MSDETTKPEEAEQVVEPEPSQTDAPPPMNRAERRAAKKGGSAASDRQMGARQSPNTGPTPHGHTSGGMPPRKGNLPRKTGKG
jgi:hypothetical protein